MGLNGLVIACSIDLFGNFYPYTSRTYVNLTKYDKFVNWQDIYHITGPLSEKQIAFMCRETLQGLAYLHAMHPPRFENISIHPPKMHFYILEMVPLICLVQNASGHQGRKYSSDRKCRCETGRFRRLSPGKVQILASN